jgi:hypothetical protein
MKRLATLITNVIGRILAVVVGVQRKVVGTFGIIQHV